VYVVRNGTRRSGKPQAIYEIKIGTPGISPERNVRIGITATRALLFVRSKMPCPSHTRSKVTRRNARRKYGFERFAKSRDNHPLHGIPERRIDRATARGNACPISVFADRRRPPTAPVRLITITERLLARTSTAGTI